MLLHPRTYVRQVGDVHPRVVVEHVVTGPVVALPRDPGLDPRLAVLRAPEPEPAMDGALRVQGATGTGPRCRSRTQGSVPLPVPHGAGSARFGMTQLVILTSRKYSSAGLIMVTS
jgi:hypothetical protein